MRLPLSWAVVWTPLLACQSAETCRPGEPVDGLVVVSVLDEVENLDLHYPALARTLRLPPCHGLRDITPGDSFVLSLAPAPADTSADCAISECPASFPTPSEPGHVTSRPELELLCHSRDRRLRIASNCEVGREVYLHHNVPARDPFSVPQVGYETPVLLIRQLSLPAPAPNASTSRAEAGVPVEMCATPEQVFSPGSLLADGAQLCANTWNVRLTRPGRFDPAARTRSIANQPAVLAR